MRRDYPARPHIRALDPEDAPAMARLHAMPGFRFGTLRPPFPNIASARNYLQQLKREDLQLGAFADDRLVATGSLHRFAGRRAHAAGLGMGVADDFSGQGIGTVLLEALLDAADNWLDLRRLELTVFADNERAIRLYARFGFEQEGLLRAFAFRDGRYANAISMARLRGL